MTVIGRIMLVLMYGPVFITLGVMISAMRTGDSSHEIFKEAHYSLRS